MEARAIGKIAVMSGSLLASGALGITSMYTFILGMYSACVLSGIGCLTLYFIGMVTFIELVNSVIEYKEEK